MESASTRTFQCSGCCRRHTKGVPTSAYPRRRPDALRFHWITRGYPEQVRTLRFTRALFGLGPSPFLLGGVIQHHLNICRPDYPDAVPEIERGLYVDDLLMGDQTVEKLKLPPQRSSEKPRLSFINGTLTSES